MAKFRAAVGYVHESVEVRPGIWKEVVVEHIYRGNLLRNARQLLEGEKVNDDISLSNSISIVADAYAREHFHDIRYVKWAGAVWTVSEVSVGHPRLLLRLGGVYNGNSTPTPVTP
jgi:hypothetical protein